MALKLIVLLLVLVNIAWNAFLIVLSQRSLKRPVPDSVSDVYDPEKYQTWRSYKIANKKVTVLSTIAQSVIEIILLVTNAYAAFAHLFPDNIWFQALSVVLLNTLVTTIVGIPFSFYDTFVIEEKFDFNKSTKKTFVTDQIKNFLLDLIMNGLLTCLFAWLYTSFGNMFILLFAVCISLISLILSFVYPLISRLFNKFKPLEEGELRASLLELMERHGYRVKAIEVMDASRRSTHMNAYFTGLGPVKRIVLYDTLAESMTKDQICAVFAHEMGHGLHHDMAKNGLISILNSLIIAVAAWLAVNFPEVYPAFGFDSINFGFAILLAGEILGILSPLLGMCTSYFSCRMEYRADAQAVTEGYGEGLVSALKFLARNELSDLSPDPLLVRLTYSHPTLDQRITAIRACEEKQTQV